MECKHDTCIEVASTKSGYCLRHYKQQWYLKKVGRKELLERTSQERWIHSFTGYAMIKIDGKLIYEHRYLAEKALGKPLPKGAIVHHTAGPNDNFGFCKLIICPSQEYHALLHQRMEQCE